MAIRDWIFAKEPIEDSNFDSDVDQSEIDNLWSNMNFSKFVRTHTFTPRWHITPPLRWEDHKPAPVVEHFHPDMPIPCTQTHVSLVASNQTNVPVNFPGPITPGNTGSGVRTSIKITYKPP